MKKHNKTWVSNGECRFFSESWGHFTLPSLRRSAALAPCHHI